MVTANDALFDEALRHQIYLRRFTAAETQRIENLLADSEKAILLALRVRLETIAGTRVRSTITTKRLEALLKEIGDIRGEAWKEVLSVVKTSIAKLSEAEALHEINTLDDAVPIKLSIARPPLAQVVAAATKSPFQGRHLKEWFSTLEAVDKKRLNETIRLGVIEGKKADEIVRDIKGRGKDDKGILGKARKDLNAVVTTAMSHVTNAAREEIWMSNSDIISGLRWTSTLDGRTSAVCRARDGKIFAVGEGPRPPAHVRCRSVMVPILDGIGIIGTRPTVVDTRGRKEREVDFKAISKKEGKPLKKVREDWALTNIGTTPAETTYTEFLRRQSAAFQDEILGKTKGQLFRNSDLNLDAFVDRNGNELTLTQLQKKQPNAWQKAFNN